MNKRKLLITLGLLLVVELYITGIFQLIVFGDFTRRYAHTFHVEEDSQHIVDVLKTRWKVIHFIDQY